MTNLKKAKWLQKHYKDYSLKWYMENPSRLQALYNREYKKYLSNIETRVIAEQKAELANAFHKMKAAYESYYTSDYEADFKRNRMETFKKAQAIAHLWISSEPASV